MVFLLYCTAELVFVCSILFVFNHCIFVFMLLCFLFCDLFVILSLLLVIMGGQYDEGLHLMCTFIYIFHGK